MAIRKKNPVVLTTEQRARKFIENLPLEEKEALYLLLGRIVCRDVKNFYSTKIFKKLTEPYDRNGKAIFTYICQKADKLKVFDNMDDLTLTEEK